MALATSESAMAIEWAPKPCRKTQARSGEYSNPYDFSLPFR